MPQTDTCPENLIIAKQPLSALIVALLILLAACSDTNQAPAEPATPSRVTEVVVHTLQRQTWQGSITTFGEVESAEEVDVASEVSGTVKTVHVDEGDRVEAGQLLLEIDPEKHQLAATRSEQAVQSAQAVLKEARIKLQRRRDLAQQESVSREVLDSAQLEVDAASAAYEQALAMARLAQRELEDTRVYSPTAGLVDIRAVDAGEAVQTGATLITLQVVSGLRIHTWVSEADVRNVRQGASARVTATGLAGRDFAAQVEWVGVKADPNTGNFPVKLILTDADDWLRPGMTARAQISGTSAVNTLLLPEEALVDRDRRRVVFIVVDDPEAAGPEPIVRLREPRLAAGFSNRLQILAGLAEGDRVVVSEHSMLRDGSRVRVQERNAVQ